ncbi:hypothetical protein [Synechocystis sp. PCC 7509]|uniref:hypothetical protein n=1 Tax=Synechocystis sp. PCC 7509 TaxID=927677 RepID=UPI0002AD1027|nr:hypothetical protein [Synechocystis sp. PCC 7509]
MKNRLSAQEQRDRTRLEKIVRDRIAEGLSDLAKIESMGTWRETHQTFDAFCIDRLGFSRSQLNIETLMRKYAEN